MQICKSSRTMLKGIIITLTMTVVFSVIGIVGYLIAVNAPAENGVVSFFFNDSSSAVKNVTVSCNAVNSSINIKVQDLEFTDAKINDSVGNLGHAVEITADNSNVRDAYIVFRYDPEKLNVDDVSTLGIATYDEQSNRMLLLEDCVVNAEKCTVTAYTTHFSQYVLVDTKVWYELWLQSQYIIRHAEQGVGYKIYISFDRSGSMSGEKLDLCKQSICDFIDNVSNKDVVEIHAFADYSQHIATFDQRENEGNVTKPIFYGAESVKQQINAVSDGGGTEMDSTVRYIVGQEETKASLGFSSEGDPFIDKFIILLTDGQSSFDDALLEKCNLYGLKIITVGIGNDVSEAALVNIAAKTGGAYVFAEEAGDLVEAFEGFEGSLLGIEPNTETDTDGDGIPDVIELSGMRNQYGELIITNPQSFDTDQDGLSDRTEMGAIVEDSNVSAVDLANGLARYVYFEMQSDPRVFDGEAKVVSPQPHIEIETGQDESCDVVITVKISNPRIVALSYDEYVKGTQKIVQNALKNVKVKVQYPSCLGGGESTSTIKTIECGDTVSLGSNFLKHEIAGEKDIIWTYDNNLKVEMPIRFDGCTCEVDHEIIVTATTENQEKATETLHFSLSDKKTYSINGDLTVDDAMVIGENCRVDVYGDVKILGGGILTMSSGSSLHIYGDFKFDSKYSHSAYLKAGNISVYEGDIILNKNYFSSDKHCLAVYGASEMNHKLQVKNSTVNSLYIDGAVLDLKLDIKSGGAINNIAFSRSSMINEVQYYDDQAKGVLEMYINAVEKAGISKGGYVSPFTLNALDGKNKDNEEAIIQTALMKYCIETNKFSKKVKSYKDVLANLTVFTPTNVDGVYIEPWAGIGGSSSTVIGTATYNNHEYSFTLNEAGMDLAIKEFMDTVSQYGYYEIKKQVNTAARETGNYIGGKIVGKYFEAYSNFCFSVYDNNWLSFLKSIGFSKTAAWSAAEKIPKIGKYIEFYNKAKALYKDTQKVSLGLQNFGNVCSTYHMDDAVEAILDIQSKLGG